MADKKSFFESIGPNTIFNDEFYKKVYGYSVCDNDFLKQVATRLRYINKAHVINEYNEWFKKWQHEYLKGVIETSRWFRKECERQWEELSRKHDKKEKVVETWDQGNLLQKKKELLLKKKLLLLNEI